MRNATYILVGLQLKDRHAAGYLDYDVLFYQEETGIILSIQEVSMRCWYSDNIICHGLEFPVSKEASSARKFAQSQPAYWYRQ